MNHAIGDIQSFPQLHALARKVKPEVVFHLAAQSLVRRSYEAPVETYATNVIGTVHLLEVCRTLTDLQAVIVITTDKCYENREWDWGYRENERLGGHDPYSSSKACAELVTDSYRRSFFCDGRASPRLASVRAGNVIGGGDWATDRLIPDAIRAFLASSPASIRSPDSVRPWQHVLEPLRGYLKLAEALCDENGSRFAEAWNFGPDVHDERPVRWVMDRLCALWPNSIGWQTNMGLHPHEARSLKLDCTKAHTRLGWWPVLDLDTALQMTVDWYRAHIQGLNLRDLTRQQIRNYMALIGTTTT
jgi:CDP-glucose 4,6-dehydratase